MKSLKIIAVLLCLLLVLPMLFACKDKGEEVAEEVAQNNSLVGIDIAIPDFVYKADVSVTAESNDGRLNTANVSYLVSVSGDDFRIAFLEEDAQSGYYTDNSKMEELVVFCDNVLYVAYYDEWNYQESFVNKEVFKYKFDFNTLSFETVLGMVAGLVFSPETEIDLGEEDKDIESVISNIFSAQSLINENGVEMTVYNELSPQIKALIDLFIARYVNNNYQQVTIDYETLEIGVGETDEHAALHLNFSGESVNNSYYYEPYYSTTTTHFTVEMDVFGSVADVEPITAPSDADEYENGFEKLIKDAFESIN